MKPTLDAGGAQGAQPVVRMVSNFQAELEHMYAEMREHMPGDEPPPAIILWHPFKVLCWPVPWLH